MDNELFELSVQAAMRLPPKNVIGTQSEHRVHGALKYLFQPCDNFHEIKLEGFICDATDKDLKEVFEIQTRAFDRLRDKLSKLLLSHPVTVIYPVIAEKRLIVVYEESGESSVRKSTKKGRLTDIFEELYKIREFLPYHMLKIKAVVMHADETRVYPGTKEKRRSRQKPKNVIRVPTKLIEIIDITYPKTYLELIPQTLPNEFNSSELAKAIGTSRQRAGSILHLLNELGFVKRVGRNKKGYIYERANPVATATPL
jgi:predicted transcriptional regulator